MRNLGVAMGAAVDELRQQKRDELQERQMGLQESSAKRADEQHGWQRGEHDRTKKVREEMDGTLAWGKQLHDAWASGDPEKQYTAAQELAKYHTGSKFMGGSQSSVFRGADGKMFVAAGGGEAGAPQVRPLDQDMFRNYLDQAMKFRISAADPSQFMQNLDKERQYGLKEREVTQKDTHHAALMKRYDEDRVSREKLALAQIGAMRERGAGGSYHPLTAGVSFDQRTGRYVDAATGQVITDPARLEGLHKMANAPRQAGPELSFKDFVGAYGSEDPMADRARYNRMFAQGPAAGDPSVIPRRDPPRGLQSFTQRDNATYQVEQAIKQDPEVRGLMRRLALNATRPEGASLRTALDDMIKVKRAQITAAMQQEAP